MWRPFRMKLTRKYNYFTKNVVLKFLYYAAMWVCLPVLYLVFKVLWGFRIIGRENVRKTRRTPAISVSNHAHNMDPPMTTMAFFPNGPYYLARQHNLEVFLLGGIVRIMRGMPLPEDTENFEVMSAQIVERLQTSNAKVHIYPEGEVEAYSNKLRKFHKGAFYFAVKAAVPIIPMTFVFTSKRRIRLLVGEPIYLEDVENAQGQSQPRQIVLLAAHVKKTMQKIMDDYLKTLETNRKRKQTKGLSKTYGEPEGEKK